LRVVEYSPTSLHPLADIWKPALPREALWLRSGSIISHSNWTE